MKTSILIVIIIATLGIFYSCSNDDSIPNYISTPASLTINGTIQNWINGLNVTLTARVFDTNYSFIRLDSDIINNDGSFELNLKTVPGDFLFPLEFDDSLCTGNVTINPPDIRGRYVNFDLFDHDSVIGFIYKSNRTHDSIVIPGTFFVSYMYLNHNVTITGTKICFSGSYDTVIYNFTGKQGWNKIVWFYTVYSIDHFKVIMSSNEPSGGKWFFHMWPGNKPPLLSSFRQKIFHIQ